MQGVAERYLSKRNDRTRLEVWKPTRNVRFMRVGEVLRVHGMRRLLSAGQAITGRPRTIPSQCEMHFKLIMLT